ncbi:serine/threonine-protein kinase [Sorangium sp. So ce204]|uniref:serine/threonine-protein kinase n=1 Tax=Sorangium sp. So ce204 TaxID=3133288 RepID=UPI003F625174
MASGSSEPAAEGDLHVPAAPGWLVVRRIAVGGMAEVFLVRGERAPRAVLKRMLPQHRGDPELVRAFVHEAELGRALATPVHPALVRTLEHGEDAMGGWIVLEHVEGATLAEILAAARRAGEAVPLGVALHVTATLLDVLAFVHGATDAAGRPLGIVHRDVTPENLLVSRDGAVKLGDFGIARSRLRDARTRTGVIKGKLAYLAPEQVTGSSVDARADLYAAGILLWELVTGRPWLDAADELSLLRAAEDPPRRSPSSLGGDPRLDPVLARALARFPEERFPTAAAFRGALAPLLETELRGGERAWLARGAQALALPGPAPCAPDPAPAPPPEPPRAAPSSETGQPRAGSPQPARAAWSAVAALAATLLAGALAGERMLRAGGAASRAIPMRVAPVATAASGGTAAEVPSAPAAGTAPVATAASGGSVAGVPSAPAAGEVAAKASFPSASWPLGGVAPARGAAAAAASAPSGGASAPSAADGGLPARAEAGEALAAPPARLEGAPVDERAAALRARLDAARASLAKRGIEAADLPPGLRAAAARAEAALAEGDVAAAASEVDTFVATTAGLRLDQEILRRKLDRVGALLRAARARGADTRAAEGRAAAALQSFLDRRYEATNAELDALLAELAR